MFKPTDPLCKAAVEDMFPSDETQREILQTDARFERLSELGRGSFSIVFKAKDHKMECDVAIKAVQLPSDEYLKSRLLREVDILKDLEHPGVIRMLESIDSLMPAVLHVVMELLPGDTLRHLLDTRGAMGEAETVPMARQLLGTLEYLHCVAHIVHRDLKPENIMCAPRLHRSPLPALSPPCRVL